MTHVIRDRVIGLFGILIGISNWENSLKKTPFETVVKLKIAFLQIQIETGSDDIFCLQIKIIDLDY